MKRGFTLVEIMAVLAILLIGGSLVFGVFTSSYKLINREKTLADMQDSFRNAVLDMEKEMNDTDVTGYEIENIQIYNINSYEGIEPVLLIKKDESNILYFKGKKSNNNSEILEKIIFDNSSINSNTIYAKESKTIINEMNGDITLSSLVTNLIEVKFDFVIGNTENTRTYSSTINLDKSKSEEVIDIDGSTISSGGSTPGNDNGDKDGNGTTIIEGPSNEPVTEIDVINASNTFAKQSTFIVLDQNPYNSRENLINIQTMSGSDNNGIDLLNASFYIQAISTEVMKKYIDTSKEIENKFENNSITKAPALKSEVYTSKGLIINGKNGFSDVMNVANNSEKYIKNDGKNVACVFGRGNEYIILVNGDLDINSDTDIKLGTDKSAHKLTIYATGKINITITKGTVTFKNCSLISANQINIKADGIKIEAEKTGDPSKLKDVLEKNLIMVNITL